MRKRLLWATLFVVTSAANANDPYVDPLIEDVLKAEGAVDVLVNLQPASLPNDLPADRIQRGKGIAKAREKQFEADQKALLGYMHIEDDNFEVVQSIPRSLKIVARIKSEEALARLIGFGRVLSLHYANRKITSDMLPADRIDPKPSPAPPTTSPNMFRVVL